MTALNPPLIPLETDILLWINQHHSPFLDAFMYMISNPGAWVFVVAVLLYYLFAKKPWQEVSAFLYVTSSVATSLNLYLLVHDLLIQRVSRT